MKICLVSAEYPPMQGGVGDCTRELARAMLELGHNVLVLTSRKATGEVHPTHVTAREPALFPLVDNWNWGCWSAVLSLLRSERPDVLNVQYQTAAYGMHPAMNLLPWRLKKSTRRPVVVTTFHDLRLPYLFPKAGAVRRWVTNALVLWSDAAIATNTEDLQTLSRVRWPWFAARPQRYLVPIGSNIRPVPPQNYDRAQWRTGLGVSADELLLCYFGFLNESKGGDVLIRTLAELVRRQRKAKLLMVGGEVGDSDPTNVAYAEYIHRLASELGVSDQVIWTGYSASEVVSANLLAADVCLLPYRDGVSFRRGSLMAALAHGLPTVSTKPGAPVEGLVEGESILLVPVDDVPGAADAVERLGQSLDLRARLGRGALELAQQFGWPGIAARTVAIYEDLLRSRRNPLGAS